MIKLTNKDSHKFTKANEIKKELVLTMVVTERVSSKKPAAKNSMRKLD